MLKYIFTFLLVAAIWGLWWALELPLWIPLVATAVAVTVLAAIVIVKFIRARRASREIEKALKAQAEQQASTARPELEADIRALQGEFDRAVAALRGSRLGKRGAAGALYSLPWYVIVGPPGVGKSTALRNSGLEFPFRSASGGASVKGVGGTRNCEWWMTTEAVILDTAGRYTTEAADRDEWFAFLDLLRKYRARRPINGVLAAVSIADLSEAHSEEVATLAREIRARIDELQDRLGVVVPVYVVFTKCDLLPGFVEMFADLGDDDRRQIWGFTLRPDRQTDLVGQFVDHYDELTTVLEKRTLRRIAEERRIEGRDKIHELPQYVAALREPLSRFIHELTLATIHRETPTIRGVYLSSGTQEGRPINRIMNTIAEGFGIQPSITKTASPSVRAKSYFLGELFRRIIFPDFKLARPSRARMRREKIWATAVGALLVLAAVGLVWLPLGSFRANREIIRDSNLAVAYVEEHMAEDTVDVIAIDRIDPLRGMVDDLRSKESDGAPWRLRFGMYQGNVILPSLRDLFAGIVRKELMLPIVERELAEAQKIVMRYANSGAEVTEDEYKENFDRLRMYLLLTAPTEAGAPGLDEEQQEWLTDHVSGLWAKPLRLAGDQSALSSIDAVAGSYIQMQAAQPELAFERETKLVEQVRRILKRSDRSKAIATALIDGADGPSLRLRDMVGVSSIRNDDRAIRPAFTRRTYEEQLKPRFEENMDDLLGDQWVLGRMGEDGQRLKDTEIEAIKTEYFKRYIAEWRTFIDSIYIANPDNLVDSLGLLTDLTRTEPFKDLFSHIAYHTQLVDLNAPPEGEEGDDALLDEVGKLAKRKAANKLKLGNKRRLAKLAAQKAADEALARRSATEALKVTDLDVTYTFLGLAEFGARQAPPAQLDPAAPPPPPARVPLDDYQEQLAFVRDAVAERLDDPAQADKLKGRVNTARSKVKTLLSDQKASGWAPTFEKLLWPPIDAVWNKAGDDIADGISSKWCNDVVSSYERSIAGRYPFNAKGYDVPLADFAKFYHPTKGEVWKFYEAVLKPAIPLRGTRFELAERGESSETAQYRRGVVAFLNATKQISMVMYPGDEETPKVEFEVLIAGSPNVKEISLSVDGQRIRYRNGPQVWTSIVWPGEEGDQRGARVRAKGLGIDADLEQEGEWGLFRVLERGKVKPSADNRVFTVQWDFRDEGAGLVQMKFRPKRGDTPFLGVGGRARFMTIFRTKDLVVPRSITGKGKCSVRGRDG